VPAAAPSRSGLATVALHAVMPPRPLAVRRPADAGPGGTNEGTEAHDLLRSAVLRCGAAVPVIVFVGRASAIATTICLLGGSSSSFAISPRGPNLPRGGVEPTAYWRLRPFVAVQFTPTGADSAGALHGFCCEA